MLHSYFLLLRIWVPIGLIIMVVMYWAEWPKFKGKITKGSQGGGSGQPFHTAYTMKDARRQFLPQLGYIALLCFFVFPIMCLFYQYQIASNSQYVKDHTPRVSPYAVYESAAGETSEN